MTTPNPAILTFDYSLFIMQCPAYANPVTYPQVLVSMYWDIATNYMSDVGNFATLQGPARQYGLNLMTAHLLYLAGLTNGGQVPYVLGASTIDKVSITAIQPPLKNQWQWWMSVSPYGQSLWALLQTAAVGGYYIDGSPTLTSFRGYGFYGYAIPN